MKPFSFTVCRYGLYFLKSMCPEKAEEKRTEFDLLQISVMNTLRSLKDSQNEQLFFISYIDIYTIFS